MFETLDFSLFAGAATRQRFCEDLVHNFTQQGFVKLHNHGVSRKAVDNAFEYTRRFFDLPLETKMKAPHPAASMPHRGFSPVGLEKVAPAYGTDGYNALTKAKAMDIKESFDVGSDHNIRHPNVWLPESELHLFRRHIQDYFDQCLQSQQTILTALALGLQLAPDAFTRLHQTHQSELRLTHYPSTKRSELADKLRIVEHTDFGSVTLLFQDAVGGLQAKDTKTGKYVPVESADRYEMIVNIGDCLQMWTANKLKSVLHRVDVPGGASGGDEDQIPRRFSIAFFAKPDRDALLHPVCDAWLETAEMKSSREVLTAGEFQESRIRGTYS